MTIRRPRLSVIAGVLAAVIGTAPIASAQFSRDVFFDWTLQQSQAVGFELIRQRLFILDNVPYDNRDAGFAEAIEAMPGSDFQRFGATLSLFDNELAVELFWVLDGIVSAVEEGPPGRARALVPIAKLLVEDAYDLVIPRVLRDDPAFHAGVMAQLLLAESSVAEGLEEAFSERWAFTNGWAAVRQIRAMWQEIAGFATPDQVTEVEIAFAEFDRIYSTREPPPTLAGFDPEEAETPAQRMVGVLENVVGAQLYAGRDLARLVTYLGQLASAACSLYETTTDDFAGFEERAFPAGAVLMLGERGTAEIIFGPADLARELMYAVGDHYGETTGLGELINLFAPVAYEETLAGLRRLTDIEIRALTPPTGIGQTINPNAPPPQDVVANPLTPRAACEDIVEGLAAGRAALGG